MEGGRMENWNDGRLELWKHGTVADWNDGSMEYGMVSFHTTFTSFETHLAKRQFSASSEANQ
jgi:hypothetical protein